MDSYIKTLTDDLLEQFREKENIAILVKAIGRQLDDVYAFLHQLEEERKITTAEGKQLDGIGDILALTRYESSKMNNEYLNPETNGLDDKTYRKHLFYKILRNTCNCTYDEIMSAISMFWEGKQIKYIEDPSMPATIKFEFEATRDATENVLALPYIKAGGVGLKFRMTDKANANLFYGAAMSSSERRFIGFRTPVINPVEFLTDEDGLMLTDEQDSWLYS